MSYVLSPAADDDAYDIIRNAAKYSHRLARAVDSELNDLLDRIGDHPGIGAVKEEITPHPYRFKLFRDNWWVVYRDASRGDEVEIIRILSVHEDLVEALLD